ncbi:MAG: TylF/MycF/NovP-related O-methyltransferase, partial [Bacteroidota bacterium]
MKFEKIDKKYLSERKKLSQKYVKENLWEIIDHWPLYVGNSNLQRFLTIYELLKTTLDIPGHIAEFGSWRGANTMFMAKVLNMLDPYSNKLVYAFDSFEGLTEFDRKDDHATSHEGSYKGNILELIDFMKLNNLEDNIVIQKGYIEKTLPVLLDADKALSFSMVYCDTDLYASTKVVLDYLHP